MTTLGVNIDHIANVRQARKTVEPDPVQFAFLAELGGACLLYTSPSPRDMRRSRMPSSA